MSSNDLAQQQEDNGWSPIWLVPLIALLLGIWMLYEHVSSQGPLITIAFATAEGLEAGKTQIKTRSVDVGVVESVRLNKAVDGVLVTARLDQSAAALLTGDTRFWVVRPRVGSGGISGLGTLLSGAYIELDPGQGKPSSAPKETYLGLEDIPITSAGTPGLALTLFSDGKQALSVADPVLYRGFKVGQVESVTFDTHVRQARYQIFVHAPYDSLISSNTHFWNVGGIEVDASAEGINVRAGSLETLLSGGVTFGVPADLPMGEPVLSSREFRLYDHRKAAFNRRYQYQAEYLILLEDSVRGLSHGAPVEYRGIRIGTVAKVNVDGIARGGNAELDKMIPVLIHLEPGRIGYGDNREALEKFRNDLTLWVQDGLSARLETGNLISGSQFVGLNFHDSQLMNFPDSYGGYSLIPTSQDGIGQIAQKVENLLDKMNGLPLENTMKNASLVLLQLDKTLVKVQHLSTNVESLLANKSTQEIPQQLITTMAQLNKTLAGVSPQSGNYRRAEQVMSELKHVLDEVQPLLRELNNKPNALLFSQPRPEDQQPASER